LCRGFPPRIRTLVSARRTCAYITGLIVGGHLEEKRAVRALPINEPVLIGGKRGADDRLIELCRRALDIPRHSFQAPGQLVQTLDFDLEQ
jgi:hypothetical protein